MRSTKTHANPTESGQILQTFHGKEVKVVVTDAATLGWTSVGLARVLSDLITAIPQGLDCYGQRVGRKIFVHAIKIRGLFLGGQTNSVADDPYNVIRVSAVVGTTAFAASGHTVNLAFDSRISNYQGLREVLYDRNFLIRSTAKDSTGYLAAAEPCEIVIRVDRPFQFGGVGAGTIYGNSLFLTVVSDSAAVVNPGMSAATRVSIEYIDMA